MGNPYLSFQREDRERKSYSRTGLANPHGSPGKSVQAAQYLSDQRGPDPCGPAIDSRQVGTPGCRWDWPPHVFVVSRECMSENPASQATATTSVSWNNIAFMQ